MIIQIKLWLGLLATIVVAGSLTAQPVITSPLLLDFDPEPGGEVGQAFFYEITATGTGSIVFSTGALPPGLSRSGAVISGIPTAPSSQNPNSDPFEIDILASDESGLTTRETLLLTVLDPLPVVTSPLSVDVEIGETFTYTIEADNNPTEFSVIGLGALGSDPQGQNSSTFSVTPDLAGQFDLELRVTNSNGTVIETLVVNVTPPVGAPLIVSDLDIEVPRGLPFTYEIVASGNPFAYAAQGILPEGVSRSGSTISGTPFNVGEFPVRISATNSFGTDTRELTITVVEQQPVIISPDLAVGEVNSSFSFQVASENAPTSFSAIGLHLIGGLSIDPATGLISGVPAEAGSFDVEIAAANDSGEDRRNMTIVIAPAEVSEGDFDVDLISVNGLSFNGETIIDESARQIMFVAVVNPSAGNEIGRVFVRWRNPPAVSGLGQSVVAELMPTGEVDSSGNLFYSGSADIGFNPIDREINGGNIEADVVATQRDSAGTLSTGFSAVETFQVAPQLEFLFPNSGVDVTEIRANDVVASVRAGTNTFAMLSAEFTGPGVIRDPEPFTDDFANPNGVFNFSAPDRISFPGEYIIKVTLLDKNGNKAVLERSFNVVGVAGNPSAIINSPANGFVTETFTPAIFTWNQLGAPEFTTDDGVILQTRITYTLLQRSQGRGYFPRNASGLSLIYNFIANAGPGGALLATDQTTQNGRIPSISDQVTVVFPGESSGYGSQGTGFVDSRADPGLNSRIDIIGELTQSGAPLESFRIFVNGQDITPGTGNLNPANGQVFVPTVQFPSTGNPAPGDYVAVIQVTDRDGKVGSSRPVTFSVVPFEEPDTELSVGIDSSIEDGESIFVGDCVEFSGLIESDGSITEVVWFVNNEEVLEQTDGPFVFERCFDRVGTFDVAVSAVDDFGNSARSATLRITVERPGIAVSINEPSTSEIRIGESVEFTASVQAELAVQDVRWFVGGLEVATTTTTPYRFNVTGNQPGEIRVRSVATDINGNQSAQSDVVVIRVREPDPVTDDRDFTIEVFSRLFDRNPTANELDQFLPTLDGSPESRVALVRELLDSERSDNTELASLIFLTMVGEWPDTDELDQAIDDLGGAFTQVETFDGSINPSTTQTYSVALTAGNEVTGTVVPRTDGSDSPLVDATLGVRAPNGNLIAFNENFGGSLNPRVDFVPTVTGSYEFIVGGVDSNAGDFTLTVTRSSSGGTGETSGNALTEALIPQYEERFGSFSGSSVVRQVFRNKHRGTSPTAQSEIRLFNSATGSTVTLPNTNREVPGYNGDLVSFVTQFALDNEPTSLLGVSGLPLSRVHLYSIPNDLREDLKLSLLISLILEERPTNARLNTYRERSLNRSIERILIDAALLPGTASITLPAALAGSQSTVNGWYQSSWFGAFALSPTDPGWIYRSDLGWLFVSPNPAGNGYWYFSSKLGTWLWASESSASNRFFYNWNEQAWNFVMRGPSSSVGWRQNMSTGQWIVIPH